MKLEKLEITPMGLSFEPEFYITIDCSYRNEVKLPIKFNGYLFLNRYRIGFLNEYEFDNGRRDELYFANDNRNIEKCDRRIFVSPISRIALEKMENERRKDKKGELKLSLKIQVTFIEPSFHLQSAQLDNNSVNLVGLDRNNSILKTTTETISHEIKIPSSDWLHDFCPVFENKNYQILELPIPHLDVEGTSELNIRIKEAIATLPKMEKFRLEGDWNGVIQESRSIWELVRFQNETNLLLANDGLNESTIESFNTLISSLFDFSSKFIHRVSKDKNITRVNNASKEDAELIYSLAFSITNLISRKQNA